MAEYQHIDHGFDPVFDERSRVLVLGSFPSVLSRENAFYYGNPRNRFWRVMAACLGEPVPPNEGEAFAPAPSGGSCFSLPLTRAERAGCCSAASGSGEPLPATARAATLAESIRLKRAMLLRHGIALWDVIESCDIKGSSDASIKNVMSAHIERVLEIAPIEAVVCNGGTAGRLYRRYLQERTGIVAQVLPSTSPANASWSLERLIERWRSCLCPLL